MAVRRRTAGPNPDSKTALIVSLVVFVILTIGAGVAAFLGWSAASDKAAALTKATQEKDAATKLQGAQEYAKLLLLNYSGLARTEDVAKLERMRGSGSFPWPAGSDEDKQLFETLQTRWNLEIGYDAVNKKKTYTDQIVTLNADVNTMKALVQQTQNQLQEASKAKQEAEAERQQAIDRFKADLTDLQKKFVALQSEKSDAFQKLMAENDKMSKDHVAMIDKLETKEKEFQTQMADKVKTIADKDTKINLLEDRIPKRNVLEYDRPKGKIDRILLGNTVYINLGSADGLREGQTFSLVGQTITGKPNRESKGKIEVVHIEGSHQAKARITEVRDYLHEPIMSGDLLYNVAWHAGMRERVALAGLIDLRGDGRDSTEEFIKELRKQHIDVDAYIDLKDLAVKGPGMSAQTSFLIKGENPEFASHENFNEPNKATDRKRDISVKMSEMESEAKRLGIEVISVRKFMNLIGFHLASGATRVPPNYNVPSIVTTTTPSSAAPKDGAKETPKEEKEK